MMYKKSVGLIVSALAMSHSIAASAFQVTDSINGNLTLGILSDYRSNGVSQSKSDPAVQGELFMIHDSGLIGGLWMSSVDFGTKTRSEQGAYVGFYKEPIDGLSITATIGRYMYPKNSTYSLNEFYSAIEYKGFKYTFIYDYAMESPNATYNYLGYTFSLPHDTSLYVEYGNHHVGSVLYGSSGGVSDRYETAKVSLKKSFVGLDWSLSYIDTSITDTECLYLTGYENSCSAGFVAGVSKTF